MVKASQPDLLFSALAEQLKVPLLQIARLSEFDHENTLSRIGVISEQALRLVDAYIESREQTTLQFEPLSTSAVIYDVAHAISPFAKACDYKVEIDLKAHQIPIMTHSETLKTILTLLSSSIIEAGTETEEGPRHIVLGSHRSHAGTVVGVFTDNVELSQQVMRQTRQLHGQARQAVPAMGSAGGAGLAIADKLSQRLESPIKSYKHSSLSGLGSIFMPSRQLHLL